MKEKVKEHLESSDVFSDPGFPLSVLKRDPQIPFPKHTHDFSELVIIYEGEAVHFTEHEQYRVGCGDVFVLTGDRAHGYKNPENLKLYNILYDEEMLTQAASAFGDLYDIAGFHALFTWEPRLRSRHNFENRLRLGRREMKPVLSAASELMSELTLRRPGYRSASTALLTKLFVGLSRSYDSSGSRSVKELSRISILLSYLEEHTDRRIGIDELCEIGGMSESSLLRLFRRNVGRPPLAYHNKLRLRTVCRLLEDSDMSITEIAYECGFSDSNYLTRLFKKEAGVSPLKWRRSADGDRRYP